MKKRIVIFLSFAFGISWLIAMVIFLTGKLENSPVLIPNTGITLAVVLLSSGYMWGPALANILTRMVTDAGWQDLFLRPQIKSQWRHLLAGWFLPGILCIFGAILFFLIFPSFYDSGLSFLDEQLVNMGAENQLSPIQFALLQTFSALLISAPINALATFGEEFGWRAFLLPELLPLGKRKALIFSSVIWGIWHWPVVIMGHNYGLNYPGYPWMGLLATIWFTVSVGIVFGWLSLKGRSVWPAVLAHGALNGLAGIGMLFLKDPSPMLLGPTPAGIIGCIPFTILSILILFKIEDKGTLNSTSKCNFESVREISCGKISASLT
ncbi:MAG: CPBP family intramembrane metalloprotease, partial [Pelolinea sp.]|nr:CPBP family intramembrane metalloprotease [Pelolinea sp.]